LNTIVLLLSGVTVTLAHQAVLLGNRAESLTALAVTIFLGCQFTAFQVFEYETIALKINESVFGSIFFFSTGFHGLHVLIGNLFLTTCLWEHYNYRVLKEQHVGLECAI
jgi:cytochrome c oxidase subunit 3